MKILTIQIYETNPVYVLGATSTSEDLIATQNHIIELQNELGNEKDASTCQWLPQNSDWFKCLRMTPAMGFYTTWKHKTGFGIGIVFLI